MWSLIAKYVNALADAYDNRELRWLYPDGQNIIVEVIGSMLEEGEPDQEILDWLIKLCTQHCVKVRR